MDIYIIPDTQIKPGLDLSYLRSIAKHIACVKPRYLIQMGDWHDMTSCSYYDKGKKSHEIYNFIDDIDAGNNATEFFFRELKKYWKGYKRNCRTIKLKGNHEDRIKRTHEYGDPNTQALVREFKIDDTGWDEVIPFLVPYKIEECYFCHYFPNDNTGKPFSSAKQILSKRGRTCIAGHQQGFDYAEQLTMDKRTIHAVIAGSCYLHDEDYKGPNNHHFRGVLILRNVKDGSFDIERTSLQNLMKIYHPKR